MVGWMDVIKRSYWACSGLSDGENEGKSRQVTKGLFQLAEQGLQNDSLCFSRSPFFATEREHFTGLENAYFPYTTCAAKLLKIEKKRKKMDNTRPALFILDMMKQTNHNFNER